MGPSAWGHHTQQEAARVGNGNGQQRCPQPGRQELGALPTARTAECPCRLFIGVCILQPFLLPLRLYSCGCWVLQGLVEMDLWRSISLRHVVYLSGGMESV